MTDVCWLSSCKVQQNKDDLIWVVGDGLIGLRPTWCKKENVFCGHFPVIPESKFEGLVIRNGDPVEPDDDPYGN